MRRHALACFACLTLPLVGCVVSTPTHHLPQGYSESYRRILRDAETSSESHRLESQSVSEPPFLPPDAVELPPIPLDPTQP